MAPSSVMAETLLEVSVSWDVSAVRSRTSREAREGTGSPIDQRVVATKPTHSYYQKFVVPILAAQNHALEVRPWIVKESSTS
jgi:hypothetical protein